MKQVWIILRKDCRRFWPEILLVLALTAAFAWIYPSQFLPPDTSAALAAKFHLDDRRMTILANTVATLLVVSWLLLIARVVHEENLIGHRQFWISRPYIWYKLLAEKLLFGIIFICIPYGAAETYMLAQGGFNPHEYIFNLVCNVLLMFAVTVLPFFAFAAVTSSLLRMIGTLITFSAFALIAAFFATGRQYEPSIWLPDSITQDHIVIPCLLVISAAALIIQYGSRRIWLSRTIMLTFFASLLLISALPLDAPMLERAYRSLPPGEPYPVQLTLSSSPADAVTLQRTDRKYAYLSIPIEASGLLPNEEIDPDNVRLTIVLPDGSRWTSPWQAVYEQRLVPDEPFANLLLVADKVFLQRAHAAHATLDLDVAMSQLHAGDSASAAFVPGGTFAMPNVGLCVADKHSFTTPVYLPTFECRTPLQLIAFARVTTVELPQPCGAGVPGDPLPWSGWAGFTVNTPPPAVFSFTSVLSSHLVLTPGTFPQGSAALDSESIEKQASDGLPTYGLCKGTPVVVTPYHLVRRLRYRLLIRDIALPQMSNQ